MKRSLVIFSGGLDSATAVYWALNEYWGEVETITYLYGQKNEREIVYAKRFCEMVEVPNKLVNLEVLKPLLSSALTSDKREISTEKMGTDKYVIGVKDTIVPNRNAIFLSIAVGYAQANGIDDVIYAAHFSPGRLYPDTRWEFAEGMSLLAKLGTDNPNMKIVAPFIQSTKAQVVRWGYENGVSYDLTWSCYNARELHCGECPACQKRKQAFIEAKVTDPTKYLKL